MKEYMEGYFGANCDMAFSFPDCLASETRLIINRLANNVLPVSAFTPFEAEWMGGTQLEKNWQDRGLRFLYAHGAFRHAYLFPSLNLTVKIDRWGDNGMHCKREFLKYYSILPEDRRFFAQPYMVIWNSEFQWSFLIMEFVEGANFSEIFPEWGKINPEFALAMRRVNVHDLHSRNVKIMPNGNLKCIDYAI